MKEVQKTNIEFLISAFAYSFALLNETFYLRKRDLKVIGVHIFDYHLISECKSEYETGLGKEAERDIKEAIIASEKGYDTHILIPRLTKEQRFEIMNMFIDSNPKFKERLIENLNSLIDSTETKGFDHYTKELKPGVEMGYLTHGIKNKKLKSNWTKFYRDKTRTIALSWLEEQKKALQQNA
ncbi:hypothetical protein [Seonamhaeicola sp.]|uniref:hypothetical protein n=1 Tax=Seonamhaeicola sp. TaxID=1912245 RepID=UPI00261FE1A2|nr:hypothetical protein [Seonamhaeicola sp.]